jgi:hypothetical protein
MIPDADAVSAAEGSMGRRATRVPSRSGVVVDPGMHGRSLYGNREIPEQGEWLRQVVAGHFGYFAVPTNSRAISAFRYHVTNLWRRTLRRRSQRDGLTWDRIARISNEWLPRPRILHPWPDVRFAVTHPR